MDTADLAKLAGRHRVDLHAPACDITDREALAAAADEHGGTGASQLVHAAGVARFGLHDQLTDVDWADVFDAKVAGLTNLTDLWPRRRDSRIVLCSSVSGVWGGHGHAAYSAANRVLDVFAAQLRANEVDCTSVRWGLWPGTAIGDTESLEGFRRAGLIAMDPDAAISTSLQRHAGDPLIFTADFDRLRMLLESQGTTAAFVAPSSSDAAGDGDVSGQRSAAEVVRAELATALRLGGPESVDLSAALIDLGVDSLLALDLRKRLRRGTGHSVPLARLLGGITGAELIEALQDGLESALD
jgi:mycobactin polyketide synthetase MbtD